MTMEEIAKALGVSKSTVSRALSGKGRIGKETAEKIQKYVQENIFFNNSALTGCIGVVIPADSYTTSIPYFHECLLGISGAAAVMQYNVMILADSPESYGIMTSLVNRHKIDGFILMRNREEDRIMKFLTDIHFPTGLTGQCAYEDVIQVDVDNRSASFTLSSMLMDRGFRSFAVVMGNSTYQVNFDRIAGFQEAESQYGLSQSAQRIYANIITSDQVDHIISECKAKKIECIICGDDVICTWVMSGLQSSYIRIPQDIAVVSLYNSANLDCFTPAVTAISMPAKRMGNMVARQLINKIIGNEYDVKTFLDYEILFRKSSEFLNR